jgi:DNA-binding XRE family transcriptional regulator
VASRAVAAATAFVALDVTKNTGLAFAVAPLTVRRTFAHRTIFDGHVCLPSQKSRTRWREIEPENANVL